MEKIKMLDISLSDEWNAYLNRMERTDIYFTPEYCRLFEANGEGKAELFVYEVRELCIIYPYIIRPIHQLSLLRQLGLNGPLYDITTPYGYGGPLTNAKDPEQRAELFRRFSQVFDSYCRDRHIVTEFVRFHPLLENNNDYTEAAPRMIRNTAFINLDNRTEEDLIRSYSRNHRKDLQKAQSSPLKVRHLHPSDHLDIFLKLYYGTLHDHNADSYYYFSESFFEASMVWLKDNLELFAAVHGDTIVCATMVMHKHPHMHYHLMGWDREYTHLSPSKLLVHSAAVWGLKNGFETFHLGGGFTGNDNLYRFKKGFGSDNELEFHIGEKIHSPELYAKLEAQFPGNLDKSFFPVYRHPKLVENPAFI